MSTLPSLGLNSPAEAGARAVGSVATSCDIKIEERLDEENQILKEAEAISNSNSNSNSKSEEAALERKAKRKDFEFRVKELKRYKSKHGDCMVPHKYPPNPSLGTWVDTQRRQYRAFRTATTTHNKKKSTTTTTMTMTAEHIHKLQEVGFVFDPRPSRAETWARRIDELQRFKNKHGHCNVREDDDTIDPGLGKWVSYVRRQYRLGHSQRRLGQHKVDQLLSMGFVFQLKEEQAIKRFAEGMEQLVSFHQKYGHTNVPKHYKENATFGLCVDDMKKEYKKICTGKKKSSAVMGNDMVHKLQELGFLAEEQTNLSPPDHHRVTTVTTTPEQQHTTGDRTNLATQDSIDTFLVANNKE